MYIVFKKKAQKDIKQIQKYRYRNAKISGQKFISELSSYIYNLSIFPEMGRMLLSQHSVRKLVYRKYIILYQINYSLDLIRIIKIIQPKQNINIILENIKYYL